MERNQIRGLPLGMDQFKGLVRREGNTEISFEFEWAVIFSHYNGDVPHEVLKKMHGMWSIVLTTAPELARRRGNTI